MAKHIFMALTNAAEGQDEPYNALYDGHLGELMTTPGFKSVQRYQLDDVQRMPNLPFKYLAIYEIETDDLDNSLNEMGARSGPMITSDLIDKGMMACVFTPIGPRVTSGE